MVAADRAWAKKQGELDLLNKARNKLDDEIKSSENKKPTEEQRNRSKEFSVQKKKMEEELAALSEEREKLILRVGNILHESVPDYAKEEDFEECVTSWGDFKTSEDILPHHEALWMVGGFEPEKGSAVAGHRGYYLRGPGVLLNQALVNYALTFLRRQGFEPVQPPYFMTKSAMSKVSQLSDFDESLYHVGSVSRGANASAPGEETAASKQQQQSDADDKYLIATSEQPLCCFHMEEALRLDQLPIKYAGFSSCFRKEAGKFGVDTWGIFRVHQFDKVEQFVITEPREEVSYAMLEKMRANAEDFLKSLALPFKTINVVAGELNLAAAKKYDINAWFPSLKQHKELVSASNCTDYQSRATNTYVTVNDEEGKPKRTPVHLLNATLCALTRTICCIMENHQGAKTMPDGSVKRGVHVPPVLVPYMDGIDFLPFVRERKDFTGGASAKTAPAANKAEARRMGDMGNAGKPNAGVVTSPAKPAEAANGVADASTSVPPGHQQPLPEVPVPVIKLRGAYAVAGTTYETNVAGLLNKSFGTVNEYVSYLNDLSKA